MIKEEFECVTGLGGSSGIESFNVKEERVCAVELAAGLVASIAGPVALLGDDQWRDLSIIGALSSGAVFVLAEFFRRRLRRVMECATNSF